MVHKEATRSSAEKKQKRTSKPQTERVKSTLLASHPELLAPKPRKHYPLPSADGIKRIYLKQPQSRTLTRLLKRQDAIVSSSISPSSPSHIPPNRRVPISSTKAGNALFSWVRSPYSLAYLVKHAQELPVQQDHQESEVIEDRFIFYDKDGQKLAVYLPNVFEYCFPSKLKTKEVKRVLKTLEMAVRWRCSVDSPTKADKDDQRHTDQAEVYKHLEAQGIPLSRVGVDLLFHWPAQGRTTPYTYRLSRDITRSSQRYAILRAFRLYLQPLFEVVHVLLSIVDPETYQLYRRKYEARIRGTQFDELLNDGYFMHQGLAVVYNLPSLPHFDQFDHKGGWAAFFALGKFDGGALGLPQHGLRFAQKGGDLLFARSRELMHEVEKFYGERVGFIIIWRDALVRSEAPKEDWDKARACQPPLDETKQPPLMSAKKARRVLREKGLL